MASLRLCLPIVLSLLPLGAAANPLAGTWRLAAEGQTVEITLRPDGHFARRDAGPDGQPITVTGRWSLAGESPWLRLTIEDWAPRRACGLLGCTPVPMMPGETYRYILQGSDTLLLEDSGGRMALRRAG